MFVSTMETISTWDRPAAYHRVLLFLGASLRPDRWSRIAARSIRDATGLSIATVERALVMLEADGVILGRGHKSGKERRLSNRLVWRDRASLHVAADPDPDLVDARPSKPDLADPVPPDPPRPARPDVAEILARVSAARRASPTAEDPEWEDGRGR